MSRRILHIFSGVILLGFLICPQRSFAQTQLTYRGAIESTGRNTKNAASKDFELTVFRGLAENDPLQVFWLVEETGAGGWAWPERYGQLTFDKNGQRAGQNPRVLHLHDGVEYPFQLPALWFPETSAWKVGSTWVDGKLKFTVQGRKTIQQRECWQLQTATTFGRNQTLLIDVQSSQLVSASRTVFMGRGDQFKITLELQKTQAIAAASAGNISRVASQLLDLKATLAREVRKSVPLLSEQNLKQAEATLQAIEEIELDQNSDLARFLKTVRRDVNGQQQRDQKLVNLQKRVLNRPAPAFELSTLDRQQVSSAALKGKIVLLHFWKYHDNPLSEPYGQVGYVDFLKNQRAKLGVEVFGVAVDEQLGNEAQSAGTKRSIKKLRDFMNLSYPILLDEGKVLKAFGDPRPFGGDLPLWVLIDPAGRVVEYKVGYYQVQRNRGLEELDAKVIRLIRARREKTSAKN